MKNFEIETMAEGTRWFYNCNKKNRKGESLIVEVIKCTNPGGKNSLPYLWNKNGWTPSVLETWWGVNTYVYDSEGSCRGAYNPTSKLSDDKKRMVLDFGWVREATPEHLEKIIDEIYKRFIRATA